MVSGGGAEALRIIDKMYGTFCVQYLSRRRILLYRTELVDLQWGDKSLNTP